MAGSGLPGSPRASASLPSIMASKRSVMPAVARSILSCRLDEINAVRVPRERKDRMSATVVSWFADDVAEIVLIAERPEGSAAPLRTGVEKVVKNSFPAACVGPGSVCNDAVHIEDDRIEPLDRDSTLRCRFILGLSDPVFHPSVSPFVRLLS